MPSMYNIVTHSLLVFSEQCEASLHQSSLLLQLEDFLLGRTGSAAVQAVGGVLAEVARLVGREAEQPDAHLVALRFEVRGVQLAYRVCLVTQFHFYLRQNWL